MSIEHKAISFPHLMKIKNSRMYRRRGLTLGIPTEIAGLSLIDHGYPFVGLIVFAIGIVPLIAANKHHNKLQILTKQQRSK